MKSLFCRLKKYSYIEYSWFANIWNNLETIFYCSLQNKKFYALLSPTYECANPELFQNRKLPARRGFKNGRPIMWVFSRQLIYSNNKCYIGTLSFTVCVDECNQWKGTSATIASQASKKKMANFINTNLHGYGRKIISDLSNFDIFLQFSFYDNICSAYNSRRHKSWIYNTFRATKPQ